MAGGIVCSYAKACSLIIHMHCMDLTCVPGYLQDASSL